MVRRSNSFVDVLVLLPWWVSVVLAAIVYPLFKYWMPSVTFANPFLKGISSIALPTLAPFVVVLLCLTAAASAFESWRKGALLESQKGIGTIRSISWQEFEELVGEAYRRKGYTVTESGGGGADGGVDLVLRRGGEKLLVQCKHWRMNKVGVKDVRELFGVIAAEGASGGVVISSGTFTQEARDFASGKPLELIDGPQLVEMISSVQKTPTQAGELAQENLCPLCGSKMVLRTAQKGPHMGEQFWGCSAFPRCRGTKPYSQYTN
jgi:restriction system protein